MNNIILYYGKSGGCYHVNIPQNLDDQLMSFIGKRNCWLCNKLSPKDKDSIERYFHCSLPARHGGKYHLALGTNSACAIWPIQSAPTQTLSESRKPDPELGW